MGLLCCAAEAAQEHKEVIEGSEKSKSDESLDKVTDEASKEEKVENQNSDR